MDDQLTQLTALGVLIVGISAVYARTFANAQMYLVQAAIDALALRSKLRPAANIIIGVVLAVLFSLLGAWYAGDWRVLGVGILAGILSSVSAAQAHDAASDESDAAPVLPVAPRPPPEPDDASSAAEKPAPSPQ